MQERIKNISAMKMVELSIVIPTLNAASSLGATLAALQINHGGLSVEIIVADGGSTDATSAVAGANGVRVIDTERGRGRQLDAGAMAASGEWLLFLHADTQVASTWPGIVDDFVRSSENATRVGAFRLALDDDSAPARRLEYLVAWRCNRFGLPYGDQGLLIKRQTYQNIGGYRSLPFLEDVDLVRRIGRRRVVMLDAAATTSSERYRRSGYLKQGVRNIILVDLFFLGVSPNWLVRLYR